jgi:hypothetical protein
MATATRMAGDEESDGEKSDGDDKKSCGRATATATKRAMAAMTRAAGDEKGDGEGGESDGDAYKEGDGEEEGECKMKRARVTRRARATRAMVEPSLREKGDDGPPPAARVHNNQLLRQLQWQGTW